MVRLLDSPPDLNGEAVIRTEIANTPDIMVARILSGETDIASLPTNLAAVLYAGRYHHGAFPASCKGAGIDPEQSAQAGPFPPA